MRTIAVSGGFDPLHVGHLRMFEEARKLGVHLTVILNNDNWLRKKKGFVFMPELERAEIIRGLKCVDQVVVTNHDAECADPSVCRELSLLDIDVFANGGDRVASNTPEGDLCARMGIQMAFNVGGGKAQSSGWLTDAARMSGVTVYRPWGSYTLHATGPGFWVKKLVLKAGARTSLQKHVGRGELWMCVEGDVHAVIGRATKDMRPFDATRFAAGTVHRVGSVHGGTIVEIGYGSCDEGDIIRLEDDYKRA
jgi:D-beta-D-heptose 7-phosphate kinase/D-beta-D-heptose 1-phosphate adenosyltransferase